MTYNPNGVPDNSNNSIDFDPSANYLGEMTGEVRGENSAEGVGEIPSVDASFEEAARDAVKTSRAAEKKSPEEQAQIDLATAEIIAGLDGDENAHEHGRKDTSVAQTVAGAVVGGMAAVVAAEAVKDAFSGGEGIPTEAKEAMDYLKKSGMYKEKFATLKQGEFPDQKFTANMISTLLGNRMPGGDGTEIEKARALAEHVPYDHELVKQSVKAKLFEDLHIDDRTHDMLEIAGLSPKKELHDEGVRKLQQMLYLVAGEKGERRSVGDVYKWRETFGISQEEYDNALQHSYNDLGRTISDAHLLSLGYLKTQGASTRWAWQK